MGDKVYNGSHMQVMIYGGLLFQLIDSDDWGHMALVNIGSGNGLVPEGTKPLPEPMLIIINDILYCWNVLANYTYTITITSSPSSQGPDSI